ncbi:MAG: pantetheine-phosphate adenylyltransferase [candidate division KSB1 bacterium]|nr:pantetheine-phosphate adenylyltransferase [candidate division KSB1 bacterium]MDZ7364893.1 pantetheine-phosphate adenylyltransferase [candidate division KSB1 bacterium]MDZ7402995.1 pantetheine-phosphate adenylyltransferase [candidate division KSB1 bacterium]
MRHVIYPGTFDPITNGHLDIIERATTLFDLVTIGVTTNPAKNPLFSVEERVVMIRQVTQNFSSVRVDSFTGLLVDYAQRLGACAIIRGLRAISDFEYEFQMALVNRKISDGIVTVFLMPNEKYTYLNSTIVKELALFGGDVSRFVPPEVEVLIKQKVAARTK